MKPKNRRQWLIFRRHKHKGRWWSYNLGEVLLSYYHRHYFPKLVMVSKFLWFSLVIVLGMMIMKKEYFATMEAGTWRFMIVLETLSLLVGGFMVLVVGNLLALEIIDHPRQPYWWHKHYLYPVISLVLVVLVLWHFRLLGGFWWHLIFGDQARYRQLMRETWQSFSWETYLLVKSSGLMSLLAIRALIQGFGFQLERTEEERKGKW